MGGSRLAISAATRFISAKRVRSARAAVKYTETGYLQAVDAAFNNWEAIQKSGR
jgi:hypothetical protein